MFLQQADEVIQPVLPVLQAAVADGAECAAPEWRFRPLPLKFEYRFQQVFEVGAVDTVDYVVPGGVAVYECPVFPLGGGVARIAHLPVVVERPRLKHTLLMGEFKRFIAVEGAGNRRIVKLRQG